MPNQKEYFQQVANIAQYIINEINKVDELKQQDTVEWLVHMGPNYSLGVIPDDGSILLNATGGLPSNLHTPLGAFNLCHAMNGSEEKKAGFMMQLIKRFSLVEVLPKKALDFKAIYEQKLKGDEFRQAIANYGPIYAITLDLDGKPIPLPQYNLHYDRILDKKTYTKKEWDTLWKAIKPDYSMVKKIAEYALPLNHHHESELNTSLKLEELKGTNSSFEWKECKDTLLPKKEILRPPLSFNTHSTKNIALNILLEHLPTLVAVGKQEEVNHILKKSQNAQELLKSSEVFTDCSGRTFNCTLFEYAYWAKDTHMCRMLVSHMDPNTRAFTLKCCENIDQLGLMYKQHGKQKRSSHYNLSRIKATLKNYLNGFFISSMQEKWLKVGLAQCDLPAHVINEYCRPDRSFDPLPSFKEPNLPRVTTYYNAIQGYDQELFPLLSENSGLGFEFSLVRQPKRAMGWTSGANKKIIRQDLLALIHLDTVRTEELRQLRDNLCFQPALQMNRY